MHDWRIERYRPHYAATWDEFNKNSRNGTFLFCRGYMDYHADRFLDCSWLAFKGNRLMAMLPANLTPDGVLHSHGGLTYGGWILPEAHLDGADLLDILSAAAEVWRKEGIKALDYKPVPNIYCSKPSQEDRYALFRMGANLTECSLSSAIDLSSPGPFNKLQRRHLAKCSQKNVEIQESDDVSLFMRILEDCLRDRHDTRPVHSASELSLLKEGFPENIRIFLSLLDGKPQAGVCIYDTGIVAHSQYIATTPDGRENNLLTPLFHTLITRTFASRRFFDFGISCEDHGQYLNRGLLRQKCSYGASGVTYERYLLEL